MNNTNDNFTSFAQRRRASMTLKVRAKTLLAKHLGTDLRDLGVEVLHSHRLEAGDHVFTVGGTEFRVDLVTRTVTS